MSQINPICSNPFNLFKIHFILFPHLRQGFSTWSLSFIFPAHLIPLDFARRALSATELLFIYARSFTLFLPLIPLDWVQIFSSAPTSYIAPLHLIRSSPPTQNNNYNPLFELLLMILQFLPFFLIYFLSFFFNLPLLFIITLFYSYSLKEQYPNSCCEEH